MQRGTLEATLTWICIWCPQESYVAYLQAFYEFHRLKVQFGWTVERVVRQKIGHSHEVREILLAGLGVGFL